LTKNSPKIACCNFIPNAGRLKAFARENGFDGVDWTFMLKDLPQTLSDEVALLKSISILDPLEVRYHCAFQEIDLGDVDEGKAKTAEVLFRNVCRLVSKLEGHFLTIHIGLGRNTTNSLSWNRTVDKLTELVYFANNLGICLCLENLGWGWTSRPQLFEKLIRKSGSLVTIDIGHAHISPSVLSLAYEVEGFVTPHQDRIVNAHIYHREEGDEHLPPETVSDLYDRFCLLRQVSSCDWWVLALREKREVLKTLNVVQEFLTAESDISSCLISPNRLFKEGARNPYINNKYLRIQDSSAIASE